MQMMRLRANEDPRPESNHRHRRVAIIQLMLLVLLTLLLADRMLQAGVALSDDSFLYIDRALRLSNDFAIIHLKPGWFPSGYGALLGVFLGIDHAPIGAASWLNATLLVVLAVVLFKGITELTGSTTTALALTLAAISTKAVTWPFQFAWSEPQFLAISAVHLYGLIRYTMTRKLIYLSIFALSGPLLIWTRYVGMTVLLPLMLFAGWDLYQSKRGRIPRVGIYVAGLALYSLVPIWSPARFTGKLGSQSLPDAAAWIEIIRGPVRKLFVATQDAVGAPLFYAFLLSALGWAALWVWDRVGKRNESAPALAGPLSTHGKRCLIVLCYALIWLAAFNVVSIEHLIEVTRPDNPIDPFIELRFAAPSLPWLLISLGALWGMARDIHLKWPHPVSATMAITAAAILVATLATEAEALSRFLSPEDTVLPIQYGYSRQHREETSQVTAFLNEAAEGQAPLVVALLAPTGPGRLPRSYYRSVFFLPHSSRTQPSALRFQIRSSDGQASYTYEISIEGNGALARSTVVRYVESTSDLPPAAMIEHLSPDSTVALNRFVLLTVGRQELQNDLAAFNRIGYRPGPALQSGMMIWIVLEKD